MDRADGSIVIACDLDDRDAQSKLNKLKADIAKLNTDIEKKTAQRDRASAKAAELKPLAEKYPAMFKETRGFWQGQADKLNSEIAQLQEQLMQTEQEAGAVAQRLASPEAVTATEQTEKNVEQTNQELAQTEQKVENINKSAKKTTGSFSKIGKSAASFGKKLLTMVKAVFIFNAISAALRGLKGWLTSVIQSDSELSAAMAQLKGALRTAAQPILNVLIPALRTLIQFIAKVVAAIASLVSSLFGTTVESSAAAAQSLYDQQNAYEGVGGAAKDASKQLAGFDEINKLTAESGGGGGGAGKAVDFELPEYGGILSKLKEFADNTGITEALGNLQKAFENLKKGWEKFIQSPAAQKVISFLGSLAGSAIANGITTIADALNFLAAVLSGDWLTALNELKNLLVDITLLPVTGITSIIDAIFGTHLTENLQIAIKAIKEFNLGEWLRGVWQSLTETWGKIKTWWGENVKPKLEKLGEPIREVFNFLKTDVQARIAGLKAKWTSIKAWYETNVKPKLEAVFQPFKDAWEAISTFYNEHIKGPVTEAATALGEAFSSAFKTALAGINKVINGILGAVETAVNWLINAINKISFDVPNDQLLFGALAGRHIGFDLQPISIPRLPIPQLAQGAVIPPNREFLAVLGDQKSGTNVEAPLETIVAAVRAAVGNGNRTVVLELDRRELGRAVLDVYGQENKRVGLKLGGSYA